MELKEAELKAVGHILNKYRAMTTKEPLACIKALEGIKQRGSLRSHRVGICGAMYRIVNVMYRHREVSIIDTSSLIKDIAEFWPKFSGDDIYPVPYSESAIDCYNTPSYGYHKSTSLWDTDTQYGKDRFELLEFLLNVFTELHKIKCTQLLDNKGI